MDGFAEAACCSFVDVTLSLGEPLALEGRAPEQALPLVHESFGEPDS